MRKLLVIPVLLALVFLARGAFYYRGIYVSPPSEPPAAPVSQATYPPPAPLPTPAQRGAGAMLLDLAHENSFAPFEIGSLITRVLDRGVAVDYLEKARDLGEKLKGASSLVVILPQKAYDREEIRLVRDFVKKGGKLVLVSDQTRTDDINGLSGEFGVIFEVGYLYNVRENAGNYTYIHLNDFAPNDLTRNLKRVVFFTSGSLVPADRGIMFSDGNTISSMQERREKFVTALLTEDSRVLAIHDMTFFMEPYNTYADNPQFLSNLADYLALSKRTFQLADFPYFFRPSLDVVQKDVPDSALDLKNFLKTAKRVVEIRDKEDLQRDMLFLGLFDGAAQVQPYLQRGEISLEGEIDVKGVGRFPKVGSALLRLEEKEGRRALVVLADTKGTLSEAVEALQKGQIGDYLIKEDLALYRTGKARKEEPTPTPTATPLVTPTGTVTATVTPAGTPTPGGTPRPRPTPSGTPGPMPAP